MNAPDGGNEQPGMWAAGIVESNRDFEADRYLRQAGYRVVALSYRKLLTGHNRVGWRLTQDFIPRPLFPGYVFVELDQGQDWPERRRGFHGFVLRNGKPLMLKHDIVWAWKERMDAGEFDDKPPAPKAARAKFVEATDPEKRRQLLAGRFAEMIAIQYAVPA